MIIRRDFVNRLLEDRKDNLRVVSGIGTSTWDLMSTGDEKNNFGFIGAMGQALPFALGLSISQPDKKHYRDSNRNPRQNIRLECTISFK